MDAHNHDPRGCRDCAGKYAVAYRADMDEPRAEYRRTIIGSECVTHRSRPGSVGKIIALGTGSIRDRVTVAWEGAGQGREDHDEDCDVWELMPLSPPEPAVRTGYWRASNGTIQPVFASPATVEYACDRCIHGHVTEGEWDECPTCDVDRDGYLPSGKYMGQPATDEPATYAWTVEGAVKSGTLAEYARDREHAHYCGADVGYDLWDGSRMLHATVQHQGNSRDEQGYPDMMFYDVMVVAPDGLALGSVVETAEMRLDARA